MSSSVIYSMFLSIGKFLFHFSLQRYYFFADTGKKTSIYLVHIRFVLMIFFTSSMICRQRCRVIRMLVPTAIRSSSVGIPL